MAVSACREQPHDRLTENALDGLGVVQSRREPGKNCFLTVLLAGIAQSQCSLLPVNESSSALGNKIVRTGKKKRENSAYARKWTILHASLSLSISTGWAGQLVSKGPMQWSRSLSPIRTWYPTKNVRRRVSCASAGSGVGSASTLAQGSRRTGQHEAPHRVDGLYRPSLVGAMMVLDSALVQGVYKVVMILSLPS